VVSSLPTHSDLPFPPTYPLPSATMTARTTANLLITSHPLGIHPSTAHTANSFTDSTAQGMPSEASYVHRISDVPADRVPCTGGPTHQLATMKRGGPSQLPTPSSALTAPSCCCDCGCPTRMRPCSHSTAPGIHPNTLLEDETKAPAAE
jgi:hypothetical protein